MQIIQDYKDLQEANKNVSVIKKLLRNMSSAECKVYPCFDNGDTDKYVKDIIFYEAFCKDCTKFKMLLQLHQAQQKQEIAKQKLLDNFRFWKQK